MIPEAIPLDTTAGAAVAEVADSAWQRLSAGSGVQGERVADWARITLDDAPVPDGFSTWLVIRRSYDVSPTYDYVRVTGPAETTLDAMVRVAGTRWSIEQGLAETKGEVGPDLAKGVIVETKTCRLPDSSDYTYEGTMRRVAGNLERLAVERIELLYIHDPPKDAFATVMGPNGALAALRKLQSEGVVGHIGVASNYPEDNTPYIETGEFAMAVVPDAYSLLSQTATERIFPAAEKFGMGIVVATPLERGILATGVRPGVDYYARKFSTEAQNQVRKMEAICASHNVSLLAVALQYVTRHPAVTTSIPGGRTPAEAAANALAGREIIPDALWTEIEPLVRSWDILAPQT